MRLTAPELAQAYREGMVSEGATVLDAGQVGTEVLYFLVGSHDLDGGLMCTASHNPKTYTGAKMVGRGALALSGDSGIQDVRERIEARKTLVDFLRDDLGLTGSHIGCEQGVCGACTVLVDGAVVRGCLMLAVQCDGVSVDTIEGISDSGAIADLQDAFARRNALQCGFCTPGMLIGAQDLLARGGVPSRDAIREHISGNYCRCTGYQAIVDAIESIALMRAGKAG